MADRTVHAECKNYEVVRYEHLGQWFVEPRRDDIRRERVSVETAAQRAISARDLGGEIHFGLPGGLTFDRIVRRRERDG